MAEYNLTRKQFADKLGITTDNLKKKWNEDILNLVQIRKWKIFI